MGSLVEYVEGMAEHLWRSEMGYRWTDLNLNLNNRSIRGRGRGVAKDDM
jgi:hypothetical protein